jgi:hypothetical protein
MGGIGYGDDDDNTVVDVDFSLYLRTWFTIMDTSKIAAAILYVDYDDAFVAYLNGVEIARAGIGEAGGLPAHDQYADYDHEAQLYDGEPPPEFLIDREIWNVHIQQGENLLTLQVHNIDSTSSDLSSATWLTVGVSDTTFTYLPLPEWIQPPPEPVAFTSSHLPIIVLDTDGREIPDEPRIIAAMGIINNGPGLRNHMTDPFTDYQGRISIEVRGASTQMFPKKSYALETQDSLGENLNVSLLGLPEENDWILYASYNDKTFARNVLTFRLGWRLGHYNPRTRYCELVLNGDYRGIYVFLEKIKVDANRIDIARLRPEDLEGDQLTGGYVLQVNWPEEGSGFWSNDMFFHYHHPNEDQLQPQQKRYIREYIGEFEAMLEGPDFSDEVLGYPAWMDVDACVDFILSQELAKNIDGFKASTFMYKDRDELGGKLIMGPLWDFNNSYGNNDEYPWGEYTEWARETESDPALFWWKRWFEDETFVWRVRQRWEQLREGPFHLDSLYARIDSIGSILGESLDRNFSRWPILGTYVWPNRFVGETYAEEVGYLKTWLADRVEWVDLNLAEGTPPVTPPVDPTPAPRSVNVYPNPFQSGVTFEYELNSYAYVLIKVYDLLGREINTVASRFYPEEGTYNTVWQGVDRQGKEVATGIYLYTVEVNRELLSRNKLIKYNSRK